MKLTFTTHDIYVMVLEMQKFIGYRVLNIYDINNKTICIKFNDNNSIKKYLLIESSSKFYMLNNFSSVKDFPSSFSSKLRKHINNKRVESIKQLNMDRVVDFQFGTGELAYHLICEFYASGNIILTDSDYKILTLIHPYTYEKSSDNEIKVNVGQIYPIKYATTKIDLTLDSFKNIINSGYDKLTKKLSIKQFITKTQLVLYSPNVLEHSLLINNINPSLKIDNNTNIFEIFTDDILSGIINTISNMFSDKIVFNGFISDNNFLPYLYKQYIKDNFEINDNFIETVSNYFTKLQPIETKEIIKLKEKEIKLSKDEKVLYNINKQIEGFNDKINNIEMQIENIYMNMEKIENYIKSILSNEDLDKSITLIEYIHHKHMLKFNCNNFNYTFDTKISVHENISNLFKQKKQILDKRSKAEIILKNSESKQKSKKIANDKINIDIKIEIKGQLKDNWFEQFNWFITSDGLLVISGKSADQNEQIVKKYMESNDIYIHSDVYGSGSCIIKNKSSENISENYPKSIIEACENLICHTKAWKLGVPDKAYWVYPSQVSKSTESGEYVSKGSFIIRGTKNYINVDKMELGLGILFKKYNKEDFDIEGDLNVEYALPVVGPYSSMNKYKFKVKIITGNQKIKKILPTVISTYYKKGNIYEKSTIKKISNDSIQRVLVTGVKFFV
jgi:predicted ribosome quality control (RQC) complex YloA/Tae2 family protein